MFTKRLVMECDWCGEYNFGTCIRDFSKSFPVYKFKPSNPIADELWLKNKNGNFADKYLSFCCEECAKAYFEDTPEDVGHYLLVKNNRKT